MTKKAIKLNKFHKISVLLFWIALILCPIIVTAGSDGKYPYPIWTYTACPVKIKFSVQDKMSVYETYNVEYRVGFSANELNYISVKTYTGHPASFDAIYPDDFIFKKQPSQEVPPACGPPGRTFWSIYVNGREISAGVIENK